VSVLRLHHAGLTVSDLDRALAFWEGFLGAPARVRTLLERPYTGRLVGHPGVRIEAAFLPLGGGVQLELLDYKLDRREPAGEASESPGHAHVCLEVGDLDAACRRALELGARVAGGPVEIDAGPNRGMRAVYLRVPPDGHTLELFEPPSAGGRGA
jgi:catechol 2,3-dioxygenase-like lactoylglutathione lyase family enzyme